MADEKPESTKKEAWLTGTSRYTVYYEDTDFSGYVYHANYLKYFERAREEVVGIDYLRELYERRVHFVVAKMGLSFHAPARHGDLIEVSTRLRLSASPVGLAQQEASSIPRQGNGPRTLLVSAEIKLVAVNGEGEAIRVPADVVEHFLGLARQAGAIP